MNPLDFLKDKSTRKSLRKDVPTPLYHLLFNILREKILNGEFDHGAQMPTEYQLAEAFDISRITAKRALDELAGIGLVERRRGKGTYITHKYSPKPVRAPLTGMLEGLRIMARETDVELINFELTRPNKEHLEAFNLPEDGKVIHVVRIRSNDNIPFAYLSSWTSQVGDSYTAEALKSTPRIDLFKQFGIKIDKIKQTISATLCNTEMASLLDYQIGQPLLTLSRFSYAPDGQLVDVLDVFYRPDQFQYQMTLGGKKGD